MKEIYLAGGCFWGLEKYLGLLLGVHETEVGYANGNTENPKYEEVYTGQSGHAETVKVSYDPQLLSLRCLLELYFAAIDPYTLNRQGADVGVSYRTGIYYITEEDAEVITAALAELAAASEQEIMIETGKLINYYPAEEYHQKYLEKNPDGYCHIGEELYDNAKKMLVDPYLYQKQDRSELRKRLSELQFEVTQEDATEMPFNNEYWQEEREGIYVDITTGEPLFTSKTKYDAGCGWPSFTKPIEDEVLSEHEDLSLGRVRTEVRSRVGDAHLGHVFTDGPETEGGLRYCINSAALEFIPKEQMSERGYGKYLELLENKEKS